MKSCFGFRAGLKGYSPKKIPLPFLHSLLSLNCQFGEEVQAEEFCRWFLFGACVEAGSFGSAWLCCSHFYRVVPGVLGTGTEEIRWVYGRLGAVAGEAAGVGKRQSLCWGPLQLHGLIQGHLWGLCVLESFPLFHVLLTNLALKTRVFLIWGSFLFCTESLKRWSKQRSCHPGPLLPALMFGKGQVSNQAEMLGT